MYIILLKVELNTLYIVYTTEQIVSIMRSSWGPVNENILRYMPYKTYLMTYFRTLIGLS